MASGSANIRANPPSAIPDVLIAGAGIIGLSLALELHGRGARVKVFERDSALAHASTAAAGMLAANEPSNPPALLPLAQLSASLYPAYLQRITNLSGIDVPFQTHATIEHLSGSITKPLAEHSLDPRQLASALLAATRTTSIDLREHSEFHNSDTSSTPTVIYATGAWLPNELAHLPLRPRKGQMLRVLLPPTLRELCEVHRSSEIYIVPRTLGPQAGTALIGATVEDAGFDTSTHPRDLTHLRSLACGLLSALADESAAPQIEAWAGLRPHTPDRLPLLGSIEPGSSHYLATGHYRYGILLAPATAILLADMIERKPPAIDLTAFSPARFS